MINDKLRIVRRELNQNIKSKVAGEFGIRASAVAWATGDVLRPVGRIRRDIQNMTRWEYPKE